MTVVQSRRTLGWDRTMKTELLPDLYWRCVTVCPCTCVCVCVYCVYCVVCLLVTFSLLLSSPCAPPPPPPPADDCQLLSQIPKVRCLRNNRREGECEGHGCETREEMTGEETIRTGVTVNTALVQNQIKYNTIETNIRKDWSLYLTFTWPLFNHPAHGDPAFAHLCIQSHWATQLKKKKEWR